MYKESTDIRKNIWNEIYGMSLMRVNEINKVINKAIGSRQQLQNFQRITAHEELDLISIYPSVSVNI